MKLEVFSFQNYKAFISQWVAQAPKKGRGQWAKISAAARIHKTSLSQVIRGDKHFALEQANEVASYLGLNDSEREYFLLLVEHERAGSHSLREVFARQLEARRRAHQELTNRVTRSRELSSEERATYYSNWIYSAVRNLTALEPFGNARAIAEHLGVDQSYVSRVLEFLLSNRLCVREGDRFRPGPQMTHLGADSPLVARHHGNWRVKAMERHPLLRKEEELAYTAPMTLSSQDVVRIRALLADLVQKADEIVGPSPSERLFCLNLDWFEVK